MDKYDNYLTIGLGKGEPSAQKIRQFKRNYTVFFPADKSAKTLDIGPGKGEMLSCLSEAGYKNIEAVDLSESVVEFCANRGFKVYQSSDLASFLEGKKYTFVTMCDVVEHISKDKVLDIVKAVYDSLEKGGVLIVQVPNMQSLTANLFMYDDFTHEAGYTERSLVQLLTLCGFNSIKCYGFEFLDRGLRSRIHLIFRKILWFKMKWIRKINGTMPHSIMHPVFFAVAWK